MLLLLLLCLIYSYHCYVITRIILILLYYIFIHLLIIGLLSHSLNCYIAVIYMNGLYTYCVYYVKFITKQKYNYDSIIMYFSSHWHKVFLSSACRRQILLHILIDIQCKEGAGVQDINTWI